MVRVQVRDASVIPVCFLSMQKRCADERSIEVCVALLEPLLVALQTSDVRMKSGELEESATFLNLWFVSLCRQKILK